MLYKFNADEYKLVKEYALEQFYSDVLCDDENYTVEISDSDIGEFMSSADDAIIGHGMVNQDYLTPLGCKLQFLYDEIYYQTKNR